MRNSLERKYLYYFCWDFLLCLVVRSLQGERTSVLHLEAAFAAEFDPAAVAFAVVAVVAVAPASAVAFVVVSFVGRSASSAVDHP